MVSPWGGELVAVNLDRLLVGAREAGVSDILFSPGLPPAYKLGDEYIPLEEPVLELSDLQSVLESVNPEWVQRVRRILDGQEEARDMTASFSGVMARFRVHVGFAMPDPFLETISSAGHARVVPFINFRLIPVFPKSFAELELPPVLAPLTLRRSGLFLVVGPSDSGKTTTLAAMTEHINTHQARHVVTIENPIEYLYERKRAVIHQREVGRHTPSVIEAIHSALRQNVAVLVVGEVRTAEEIAAVMEAVETGHLVMATMHASGVVDALSRWILSFPREHRDRVQGVLASTLLGIIAQRLLPLVRPEGAKRRVLAYELVLFTGALREKVRQGRFDDLYQYLVDGTAGHSYNVSLEQSLAKLVQEGRVLPEVARAHANREEVLIDFLRRGG